MLDTARAWSHWYEEDADHMAHPYDANSRPTSRTRQCRTGAPRETPGWRRPATPARGVERWYRARLESARSAPRIPPSPRASSCSCRCSTTTPPCTARSARHAAPTWARERRATRGRSRRSTRCSNRPHPRPELPGRAEPGLARIIGVMLKLDFQRAVLQRIPKMAPSRTGCGATCCSSATSTTPLRRWGRPTTDGRRGRAITHPVWGLASASSRRDSVAPRRRGAAALTSAGGSP